MRLTEDDYAALERCYITRALAQAAGLYRVDSLEGRERVGRNGAPGDFAGIDFPNRWPGTTAVIGERLRRDHPPVDAATHKIIEKYLAPPGQRNRIYFPLNEPAWLTDVSLDVVISEGEKKYLALLRAAWEGAQAMGHNGNGSTPPHPLFMPLTFGGVWSWKGQIGIATDANGFRVPEKGPIPDLDKVTWNGRRVVICYDTNARTNDSVRAARWALARELEGRGAEVFLIDLPPGPGINGVDDYLAQVGLPAFLELLKRAGRYDWHDELVVSDKGKILASFGNALTALRLAPVWRDVLGFNEFALRAEARAPAPWGGRTGPWDDHGDLMATEWLEHQGVRISDAIASKAIQTVAREHPFHPVKDYLNSLKWDGSCRIDLWLWKCLGVNPDKYTRAVAHRWLVSAVARIFAPGCQVDHALILEGAQGIGKSSAFKILGGEFFSDDIADLGTKDAAMGTAGVWIVELAELDAMGRTEVSKVKSFLSRREDRFRPAYGRHLIWVPRRCVFCGTVNQSQYLKDETGGRRFWPVKCGPVDLELLRRDRDQLWAEAVVRYQDGEVWWLDTEELTKLATEEQEERRLGDAWEILVSNWLTRLPYDAMVTTADALTEAIKKDAGTWGRFEEGRIGEIYKLLGWEIKRRPSGGSRRRLYGRRDDKKPDEPQT